jgi:glycine dehydrogenase subunit 1
MTPEDESHMLRTIGVQTIEDLFVDIPDQVRMHAPLDIPEALSEPELFALMQQYADANAHTRDHVSFLGAGIYDHHCPALIPQLLSRGEFVTAYTPYQPELAQGGLQAMFEFQSFICALTGMDVANASMYDGATALAEAAVLACQATKRNRIVISAGVHPHAISVLQTTARGLRFDVDIVPLVAGHTDPTACNQTTAAVIVQTPHFYGGIEDVRAIAHAAHACGALCIVSANPLSLAILEAPGVCGADVVVGDAQPFGIAQSFGGPTCGYFAVTQQHMRRIPGRLVGQTVDREGKRGFVLTLQTREQHIRREKATSNICSNQALLALCASMYVSIMGKQGIQEVARQCVAKAHYAKEQLCRIPGVVPYDDTPTFHEFAVRIPHPRRVRTQAPAAYVLDALLDARIIGGYDLGRVHTPDGLLVAVTERRTKQHIDQFAQAMEDVLL